MELSEQLEITASSVRRCWLSIYDRVATLAPEVLGMPVPTRFETANTVRGKSKKYRLLAYLRDHPEELRPLSRRRRSVVSTQNH